MDHQAFAQLLGNYGEFVRAIAVVATLGYLAVQVRQNTRTTAVSRGDAAQRQLAEIHERIFANKDLAELVAQCRSPDLPGLSPGDEERVRRVANFYISSYANVENAYRQGELVERSYESYCRDFRRTLIEYPALKPRMRAIMEHFDKDYFRIVQPLYE